MTRQDMAVSLINCLIRIIESFELEEERYYVETLENLSNEIYKTQ